MALASKERFEWDEHVPDKPTPQFDAEPTNASMGLEYAYARRRSGDGLRICAIVIGRSERAMTRLSGLIVGPEGMTVLVGAFVVVTRSRSPTVIGAYMVFVPLPLFVTAFDVIGGVVTSLTPVWSYDVTMRPWEVAGGLAEALFRLVPGLLASILAYLVTAVGLFIRTVDADGKARVTSKNE
jgi:hypothetical protein